LTPPRCGPIAAKPRTLRSNGGARRRDTTKAAESTTGARRSTLLCSRAFFRCGSIAAARAAGLYRMEGREYGVQDGDVMPFKFAV
jgi:ribosome-binding ATPase